MGSQVPSMHYLTIYTSVKIMKKGTKNSGHSTKFFGIWTFKIFTPKKTKIFHLNEIQSKIRLRWEEIAFFFLSWWQKMFDRAEPNDNPPLQLAEPFCESTERKKKKSDDFKGKTVEYFVKLSNLGLSHYFKYRKS